MLSSSPPALLQHHRKASPGLPKLLTSAPAAPGLLLLWPHQVQSRDSRQRKPKAQHSHLAMTLPQPLVCSRPGRRTACRAQDVYLVIPNSQGEARWAPAPAGSPLGSWAHSSRLPSRAVGQKLSPGRRGAARETRKDPGKLLERGHACLIPRGPATLGLGISREQGRVSSLNGLWRRSQDPATPSRSCLSAIPWVARRKTVLALPTGEGEQESQAA